MIPLNTTVEKEAAILLRLVPGYFPPSESIGMFLEYSSDRNLS